MPKKSTKKIDEVPVVIKGYKAFDKNLKCKDLQYEIGVPMKYEGKIHLCQSGLHFCLNLNDCFNYYEWSIQNTRICEVEAVGISEETEKDSKRVCQQITPIRELTHDEVLKLVNSGRDNTGRGNSGHDNSGDGNSGHDNSGDRNSGDRNSGDGNSGYGNSGNRNSGYGNSGHRNSGDRNSGYGNSGNRNSGYDNSGHRNSGDGNSGYDNSGDGNSGYGNSGDSNSGYGNSGHDNSGSCNICNYESGCFNSVNSEMIRVFNQPCEKQKWIDARKPDFIFNIELNKWIDFNEMSDTEKLAHPKAESTEGYLKMFTYQEAWATAFKTATPHDIELLKALPNFDPIVFKEITGITIV